MKIDNKNKVLIRIIIVVITSILSWFSSEINLYDNNFAIYEFKYVILNVATLVCAMMFFYIIIGNLGFTLVIWNIFVMTVSVTNYYIVRYHLMPESWFEFRNVSTAASYVTKFEYNINATVFLIILINILGIALAIGLILYENSKGKLYFLNIKCRGIIFLSIAFVIWFLYSSPFSIKPRHTLEWTWRYSYPKYGFAASAVESFADFYYVPVIRPDGYDERIATQLTEKNSEIEISNKKSNLNNSTQLPDIILILNETFYDVRQALDIKTDKPFMNYYDTFEGIKGYACAPRISGCTNYCEFELLTGNSTKLVLQTPFLSLNMNDTQSCVTALKELGYETMACHPEDGANYGRDEAYTAMGFDNCYFIDSFSNAETLRGDGYLISDECIYENLISWYENMGDGPRFCYSLTMQNHGGYDLEDDSEDSIHVVNDYDDNTSIFNEYLTSIENSDRTFYELTKYFENSDRPVIICMVGDHAPYFVDTMNNNVKENELEKLLKIRSTPYMIWSNDQVAKRNTANNDNLYIGLNGVFSLICSEYGIDGGTFYNHLGMLNKEYPVIANSMYMDKSGTLHSYKTEDIPVEIQQYFYASYKRSLNDRE